MHYELNIKGEKHIIRHPEVMGILNCTPDSFYASSRQQTADEIARRVHEIIAEGGTIIDVGGMSTRPGGTFVTEAEEMQRLRFALPIVKDAITHHPTSTTHTPSPNAQHPTPNTQRPFISVDTYRPSVARMAVEDFGVDIINDVGAPENRELHSLEPSGRSEMYRTIARLHVPYVLMASQPTAADTLTWLSQEINRLREYGAEDIILDPGYGFGKTLEQNFEVLGAQQRLVDTFRLPFLVGVSRKRMVWQTLGTSADEALNGTTVINTLALERGAAILRVHDVREAVECVRLLAKLQKE